MISCRGPRPHRVLFTGCDTPYRGPGVIVEVLPYPPDPFPWTTVALVLLVLTLTFCH